MPRFPASLTARHAVLGPLGSGGRGMVWHTRRLDGGGQWAVKVLHTPDPAGVARMKAEYRTLARADHPGVVQPHRLWASADLAWFSMRLIEQGTPLPRWADKAGLRDRWTPHGLTRLRPLLARLVESMVAIHRTGVVHRDIKPDNILVDNSDQVFLLDLDLSAPPTDASLPGRILGTPGYRAPELGLGLQVGAAADWFGLGAVLYELFTGRAPFGKRPRRALRAQRGRGAPDLATARPDVPPALARMVGQLLHSEPHSRPQLHHLLRHFGAEPVKAAGSTLEAIRRATLTPGSLVELTGATAPVRRAALADASPANPWRISLRFGIRSDPHLGPIDAFASGLARLLHLMPREQRLQALPRDPSSLLCAIPDLALLRELQARRPAPGPSGSLPPIAALTHRLSQLGPLTVHLEDVHLAAPEEIAALDRILADSVPRIRAATEGMIVDNTLLDASLRKLKQRFLTTTRLRCTPDVQSPVKPDGA